jgi:hypothetical protein
MAAPRLLGIYPGLISEEDSVSSRFGRDKKEMPPAGFKHRNLDIYGVIIKTV